jgi:subtilisin family serine protease
VAAFLVAVAPALGPLGRAGAATTANDPAFDRQWGMRLIGAPEAWAKGTGAGVTVAVVDSGVDLDHEDLASKLVPGINIVSPGQPPQDDNGHGTHVAGIVAAATNNRLGVASAAPDARIMPVKVFKPDGTATEDAITAGVRWAVDHGAKVVNMSFGDAGDKLTRQPKQPILGPAFAESVRYAWDHGAIPVVAAGNGGANFFTSSGFSNENALVVMAVTRDDNKASYSSDVGQAKWGIAAPGGSGDPNHPEDSIFSSYWNSEDPAPTNYYAYSAGTSMAAPHVAGAAAVLLSRGLDPLSAVQRLLDTAKDLGAAGNDSTFGHGRLNMAAAVASLSPLAGAGATPTTSKAGGRTGTTRGAGGTATSGATGSTAANTTQSTPTPSPDDAAAPAGRANPPLRVVPPTTGASDEGKPWGLSALALALLVATSAWARRAGAGSRPGAGGSRAAAG